MMEFTPPRSLGLVWAFLALWIYPSLGFAQYQASPSPAAYALENVTLVHADGREEVGVNVLVRRGLIQAMGPGIGIPPDAYVLDGESLWVYPGLVDGHGSIDLDFPAMESGQENLAWNPSRMAQGFTPHRMAAQYLAVEGADLKSLRTEGIIGAAVHPEGGMAPGQSVAVLLRKTTRTPQDLVVRPSLGFSFSFQGGRGVYPSSLFAVVAHFRQMFEDAAHYGLVVSEYARDPAGMTIPKWDPDFDALRDAASGSLPVYFMVDDDEDIRRVLKLSDEIGFRPVIVGGEESWQLADELAARGIPVLLSVAFPTPSDWKPAARQDGPGPSDDALLDPSAAREKKRLEDYYSGASRLSEAGVTLALTSGGRGGDLLEGARKAMEYGLSEGDALKALTSTPANLLGMPHITTLGQGMAANFIVTDGPLFEEETSVRYTFVEGEMEKGKAIRSSAGGEAPSVNVSGVWEVSLNAEGMEMSFDMTLTQDDSSFSGSMNGPEMGEARVTGGVVSGNALTFTLVFSMGTDSMEVDSRATVNGEEMTGSGSGAMGSFTFTASRRPGEEGGVR